MGLLTIQISRMKNEGISASGVCRYGDPTPIVPGEYPWQALKALTPEGHVILAEVSAPLREKDYFLEPALPQYPLQPRFVDQLSGRGIILGVLRSSTAPFWFEHTEIRRGYIVNGAYLNALVDRLGKRRRMKEFLEIASVQFEHHCTRTLVARSTQLSPMAMADALIRLAYEMKLPVSFDEREFKDPPKTGRFFRLLPLRNRLNPERSPDTFTEENSPCSISSLWP